MGLFSRTVLFEPMITDEVKIIFSCAGFSVCSVLFTSRMVDGCGDEVKFISSLSDVSVFRVVITSGVVVGSVLTSVVSGFSI